MVGATPQRLSAFVFEFRTDFKIGSTGSKGDETLHRWNSKIVIPNRIYAETCTGVVVSHRRKRESSTKRGENGAQADLRGRRLRHGAEEVCKRRQYSSLFSHFGKVSCGLSSSSSMTRVFHTNAKSAISAAAGIGQTVGSRRSAAASRSRGRDLDLREGFERHVRDSRRSFHKGEKAKAPKLESSKRKASLSLSLSLSRTQVNRRELGPRDLGKRYAEFLTFQKVR